jgi:hypothetical protein
MDALLIAIVIIIVISLLRHRSAKQRTGSARGKLTKTTTEHPPFAGTDFSGRLGGFEVPKSDGESVRISLSQKRRNALTDAITSAARAKPISVQERGSYIGKPADNASIAPDKPVNRIGRNPGIPN